MKDKVILIGGFHEIIEICEIANKEIIGIIDNNLTKNYFGYEIIGTDEYALSIYKKNRDIPIIITPDKPQKRKKLCDFYSKIGFNYIELIHPNSLISKSAYIGMGVVIQYHVNVSSLVKLGRFVKINTMANIMHDCTIGDYTTIAPNAVILGGVKIGNNCYIGANSTIMPNVRIGDFVIVGAGAVVTKDVNKNRVIIGNPGKEK